MTWIDIDYLLDNQTIIVYEPRTFEKYLMVSKHRKKMSVYYNEVKNRANSNVHNSRCRDDTDCYVTTNRFKRTETYTREQLESDLTTLVSDLEKDGILQQDDTEDE